MYKSEIQDKIEKIAFFDFEVNPSSSEIVDIGAVFGQKQYHGNRIEEFVKTIEKAGFFCGHNILAHDFKYLKQALSEQNFDKTPVIDTLLWSPLLFPKKPYHKLVKDYKLEYEQPNDPLNDSKICKILLEDEISAYNGLNPNLRAIFYLLLHKQSDYSSFFRFFDTHEYKDVNCEQLIKESFKRLICQNSNIREIIDKQPVELAYALAIINVNDIDSITPRWVMVNYPKTENLVFELTNKMCKERCNYCLNRFDAIKALKRYFHFEQFRTFSDKPLQEEAVRAVIENNDSILAVFPTGGGKSITFQLPALIAGEAARALTVVISPLQSLMKDQVDNLEKKDIVVSTTINGLLDPIERRKAFERTEEGQTSIIYLSPESLRSKSIERLLLSRNITRFVIDEAHCFSSWGQDFRVDYLYIGDFIKNLQEKKGGGYRIQVSCFTATAKVQVIEDIKKYFKEKLDLDLKIFTASGKRKNLQFKVIEVDDEPRRYSTLRALIEEKECPTIVYTSKTKTAELLAEKLSQDRLPAIFFHGKMDSKQKVINQEDFIKNKVNIIVATSAFGMGVDKSNVGLVVHYNISDSLENYIQESGRAARDENLTGECYILFNKKDLDSHFLLLNRTRINQKEIEQIWMAIKKIMQNHSEVSCSALEIARKAGWDDNVFDIETRVTTAISALETAGFVKRGQNNPRVYANSIMAKSTIEAREKIEKSGVFTAKEIDIATQIMSKLFSALKRSKLGDAQGENRVEYLADSTGINRKDVLRIINLLREAKLIGDSKDLTAELKSKSKISVFKALETYYKLEEFLLNKIEIENNTFEFKKLNESAKNEGYICQGVTQLKKLVNFWEMRGWVRQIILEATRDKVVLRLTKEKQIIKDKFRKRQNLASCILKLLLSHEETELKFSVLEIKTAFEQENSLLKETATVDEVEEALFFLSRIGAIIIEGGFMVIYNRLFIKRLEDSNRIHFKKENYNNLASYYKNKTKQIHIAGEYAQLQLENREKAQDFVNDYFELNFDTFLKKYFSAKRRAEIEENITPEKFQTLFGSLSERQLSIIKETDAKRIVVAAGPGSGKTRILVHKLASLILLEDVKHEQLLMLTFSRAAVTEFKKRLIELIGNAAHSVEIKTFHSYCFDLLGKVGSLEDSDKAVENAIKAIKNNEVEKSRITKTVLVIDEAQDINKEEFELISTLIEENENLQLIAVGDDDQNIYEFRGSNSDYLRNLLKNEGSKKIELIENFRSNAALVKIANDFSKNLSNRLKTEPLTAKNSKPGFVELIQLKSNYLFEPMLNKIKAAPNNGTSCILTFTNINTIIMAGILKQNGIPAKLIQSNSGFNISNLLEVRFFLNLIEQESENKVNVSDEIWQNAKKLLKLKYQNSSLLEVTERIIDDFYKTANQSIYLSDFKEFLFESKLDDFYTGELSEILVSTIHKSKGKEFDNVYLMLNNCNSISQEKLRELYVAITRAKTGLTILTNNEQITNLIGNKADWQKDNQIYEFPKELIVSTTHKDVYLDYFYDVQENLADVIPGSQLKVTSRGCSSQNDKPCLKFSGVFSTTLEEYKKKGYNVEHAEAEYIIWWQKKPDNNTKTGYPEIKIVLPKIYLKKS